MKREMTISEDIRRDDADELSDMIRTLWNRRGFRKKRENEFDYRIRAPGSPKTRRRACVGLPLRQLKMTLR